MTYEEAKMQIQAIPEKIWDQLSEPDREAMEMAFSALQAQDSPKPTAESVQNVQNEDLILRKAAIDAICNACSMVEDYHKCDGYPETSTWCDELVALRALPSAQPEPLVKESRTLVKDLVKDTISRQAAIDAAENAFVRGLLASPDIRKLPTAQPEPQWIPVSERLPESKHEDLEYPTVIVCCGDGAVTLACYYESTKEWGTGEYYDRIINPVAWMPLPEPYRAERRTDG